MKTVLIVLATLASLVLAPSAINLSQRALQSKVTSQVEVATTAASSAPKSADILELNQEVKLATINKVLTLEDANTVVLRGPILGSSVGKAIKQLQKMSNSLAKDQPIYLVLDTPGGSIPDGMDLIDFIKSLPQKVHTVTLFAASMGFQIVQNLDTRYIARSGVLMSHRASVMGLGGQVKGELETRYRSVRRIVDFLDHVAASRLGMVTKDYESMIVNEYWVYGFDAINEKAADQQVLIRCGDSLNGTDEIHFQTLFGPIKVTFSKCPMIREPEAIDFGNILGSQRENVERTFRMSINNKTQFVNEYIVNAKFSEIFK